MAEYEASRGMPADSLIVFDVASDLDLLDRWLPSGLHVRDGGSNTVEAEGDLVRGEGEHEGLIDASTEQLRVEWGGRDHPEYAGWLQVADSAAGASEVTVHLSQLDEPPERTPPQRAEEIETMLGDSLDRLADEVERRISG
jgi:hypothetical protein